MNKSTKLKASYIARTTPNAAKYANEYDEALERILPTLFGRQLDDLMLTQAAFPISHGGLGLNVDSKEYCNQQYQDSQTISYPLVRHIVHGEPIGEIINSDLKNKIKSNRIKFWNDKCFEFKNKLDDLGKLRMEEFKILVPTHG